MSQGHRTIGLQRVALDRYKRWRAAHRANSPYKAIYSEDVAATDRNWCVLTSYSIACVAVIIAPRYN